MLKSKQIVKAFKRVNAFRMPIVPLHHQYVNYHFKMTTIVRNDNLDPEDPAVTTIPPKDSKNWVHPDAYPPLKVGGDSIACNGTRDPVTGEHVIDESLGHPIEYLKLSKTKPTRCKYCGLRYIQVESNRKSHH
mmetsp:Transcript_11149/g.16460  ORF Transcript_11149/g.16460 Transcript_11149/m.16460 type:complete len:133 (-) Transcript_11149:88-486(-)